jgi:hypothetical protein
MQLIKKLANKAVNLKIKSLIGEFAKLMRARPSLMQF